MRIYYEDKDITSMVLTKSCIVKDTAGDRCDSLEIVFENAAGWYSWGPEEDDRIVVTNDAYDSGIMYVNTVIPEDGKFRILATSLPCAARNKAYKSYSGKTIEEIMRDCAVSTGMGYRIYGIDENTVIPYIQRKNEGAAAFLSKLLMLESAALKCINGIYTAIGYEYAQDLKPVQSLNMLPSQQGLRYSRSGQTLRALTVKTPYAKATAVDKNVGSRHPSETVTCLPAMNDVQAGRWARGKLLSINRKAESVHLQTVFNPTITAMMRVDITGGTDATGEWLVQTAAHDLVNQKTSFRLHRCVRTIGGAT